MTVVALLIALTLFLAIFAQIAFFVMGLYGLVVDVLNK